MELFEELRRGYAAGETILRLAEEHRVHRRTVGQAISSYRWGQEAQADWYAATVKVGGKALKLYDSLRQYDIAGEENPAWLSTHRDRSHDCVPFALGLSERITATLPATTKKAV